MPYANRCLLVITALFSLLVPRAASGLSIYDVIMLSQNRYEAENIVDIIRTTGSAFTLTATDVVYLKTTGISDSVVQAMLVAVPPAESQEAETNSTGNKDWLNVTLDDLLLLANGEVSDAIILSFIRTRETAFIVGAREIVKLREAGLSDEAIQYLLLSENIAMDSPADYYDPPPMGHYPPAVTLAPTVTSNRYRSAELFDAYPRHYSQTFIVIEHHHVGLHDQREEHHVDLRHGNDHNIGLGNHGKDQHSEEHHVGLHHGNDHNIGLEDNGKGQPREEHHVGLHHEREHHVGLHDGGKGQHIGLHHLTPGHTSKYHSVNNSNTHRTSINKSQSITNDRGHSVIGQRGHNAKETNGQGISHNRSQRAGYSFNRQVHRGSGNKSGPSSSQTINRNKAHTSQSPAAPRTARPSEEGSRDRSTSRTSTHSMSHDSARLLRLNLLRR